MSDILSIFFEDVAKLPIIGGKYEYLPLTRRIQRGRTLLQLEGSTDFETFNRLQDLLCQKLEELAALHSLEASIQFIDKLSNEIEEFLDHPEWSIPSSIINVLGRDYESSDENFRSLSWECFYLLALLPPSVRTSYKTQTLNDAIISHFDSILQAYNEAKQTLLEGTLRYVIRLARYYLRNGISYLDLVQEGFLGLMQAVDKFEESQGSHFQSYAATWIQQRIMRFFGVSSRLIRVPVHQHDKFDELNQKWQQLLEQQGSPPSDFGLFLAMGWMSPEEMLLIQQDQKQKRFSQLAIKLMKYRYLISYRDKPVSEIPNDMLPKIVELDETYAYLSEKLGYAPDEKTLLVELGWLTKEEINHLEQSQLNIDSEKLQKALSNFRKAQIQFEHFRIGNAIHHSLERTVILFDDEVEQLAELLLSPDETEQTGDDYLLEAEIQALFEKLSDREKEIINFRFGLIDQQERTLEEVGQLFGVTRERIRQIEHKVLAKLQRAARKQLFTDFIDNKPSLVEMTGERMKRRLINLLPTAETLDQLEEQDVAHQKAVIQNLIEKYIMQGRKRTSTPRSFGSRSSMYAEILTRAGHPLHYTAIHERILEILPTEHHFPKQRTYATLFYSDKFQLLGEGTFGLADWEIASTSARGEKILHHCPQPMLSHSGDPRSFFESIMVGRELLKRESYLNPHQFYREMQGWAQDSNNNWINAQSAFDAWYAAGLIEYVDILKDATSPLRLALPLDAKLNEIRLYCLNSLCQRILKMPELLLTVTRIARPTTSDIQKVLFGNERGGFDVPMRLNILVAFEAIQYINGEWLLTPIGEIVLRNNPPQELPDFSVIDEAEFEDQIDDSDDFAWEEELGLLEL